jgi:phosphatidate cytidylyltransferase
MKPLDDLDPPSFQFGRGARRRRAEMEEAAADEAGDFEVRLDEESDEELEIPRFPSAGQGPEITVSAGAGERKPPLWRRLPFARGETAQRVLVAIPWIAFAIFIVAVGGEVFMLAMIGLGVLALRELFRMAAGSIPIALPAYAVVAGMVIAAHYGTAFQILLVFACSLPAIFIFAAARNSHEGVTVSMAITVLGITWFGLGFSHAMLLRDLPDHGGALLVDVLVATFLGDTAAYGAGRLFGSRRITPRISPNKTLEGLVGGFVGGTLGFWFAGLYQDWLPGIDALVMGMVVAAVAPIGDLFASLIKRDLDVKDTGTLFGPHGGLIDRLDAVIFTVVAGYYLAVAFVY